LVRLIIRRFAKEVDIYSSRKFLSRELKYSGAKVYFLEEMKKEVFLRNWPLTKGVKRSIKKDK